MIVGLTGHSGSGKTTVAHFFAGYGFCHIDCDNVVHTRVYTDPAVHDALSSVFGDGIVKNGEIDRRALARVIFSDEKQYNNLMITVKPFIDATIRKIIDECGDQPVLVDAPALFEYGMQDLCDITVGVISDDAVARIVARDNISEDEAAARLAHQQSHDFYKKNCDYVIENNGSLCDLEAAVKDICTEIMKGDGV